MITYLLNITKWLGKADGVRALAYMMEFASSESPDSDDATPLLSSVSSHGQDEPC